MTKGTAMQDAPPRPEERAQVAAWLLSTPTKLEFLARPFMKEKYLSNDRPYDIFHPSAWGVCIRKIAYQWYNEQYKFVSKSDTDIDFRMERLFDNGHGMHARWRDYLDGVGVLRGQWKCANIKCEKVFGADNPLGILNPLRTQPGWFCPSCGNNRKLTYEEIPVWSGPKYNFLGHIDGIVDVTGLPCANGNNLDLFIVDFKSMKDEYFSALKESKPEHVIQVHVYMWLKNLHGAVVLYENKDNQQVKEIFVPRNEALITAVKQQALWLIDLLRHRKLPHRPEGFTRSDFPCMKCEFKSTCYS